MALLPPGPTSSLTILPIDMIGYILLISVISLYLARWQFDRGPLIRPSANAPERSCPRPIAKGWLLSSTVPRELHGAPQPAFCRPTAWWPQPTGPRWKSTQPLATDRGEHEPLLAGGRFGMSTPHCQGRYNPLRVHDSAIAERNPWSVLRPLPQL